MPLDLFTDLGKVVWKAARERQGALYLDISVMQLLSEWKKIENSKFRIYQLHSLQSKTSFPTKECPGMALTASNGDT